MLRAKRNRLLLELSQKDVADQAGIPRPYLSQIEHGRLVPTAVELAALSAVLKCSPDRLLDHVSADNLEPGAEARDAQREAR